VQQESIDYLNWGGNATEFVCIPCTMVRGSYFFVPSFAAIYRWHSTLLYKLQCFHNSYFSECGIL